MRDANAVVERCDPHCIAWARATASLWGMASDHDLDEPVCLTATVPVRLRCAGEGPSLITDRELLFGVERAGTHVAVRFYFEDGTFFETELTNISRVSFRETVHMRTPS